MTISKRGPRGSLAAENNNRSSSGTASTNLHCGDNNNNSDDGDDDNDDEEARKVPQLQPNHQQRGLEPRGRRLDGMLFGSPQSMTLSSPVNQQILWLMVLVVLVVVSAYNWITTDIEHDYQAIREQSTSSYLLPVAGRQGGSVEGGSDRQSAFSKTNSRTYTKKSNIVVGKPTSRDTTWAFRESYGILDDILDASWKRMRERARTFDQYLPEKQGGPAKHWHTAFEWYIFNLQPILNCPHVIRVGGHGDGPKWICNPHKLALKKDCLIYSVGSAGVFTWEDTLVEMLPDRNCEIHVFDPEPKYERPGDVARNNIHFHPWGLKSSYAKDGNSVFFTFGATHELKTFPEIIKALGHEDRRIDIFKIDCEGCEWYTYKDWISYDISQISIEVHGLPHPNSEWYKGKMDPSEFYDAFPAHGFAMYTKEVNSYGGGKAIEFSFLKMHYEFWENAPIFQVRNYGNRIFGPHPNLQRIFQSWPLLEQQQYGGFNENHDYYHENNNNNNDGTEAPGNSKDANYRNDIILSNYIDLKSNKAAKIRIKKKLTSNFGDVQQMETQ